MLYTVDSDVVNIGVHLFPKLNIETLWTRFGVGKNVKFIACHEIVNTLTLEFTSVLLFFNAFTRVDTVSAFDGHGKKRLGTHGSRCQN